MPRKKLMIAVLCGIFLLVSLLFINPYSNVLRIQGRTTSLKKVVTETDDGEKINYVDSNGIITFASDAGYATMIVTVTDSGRLEQYYDENGEACAKPEGNYKTLREYDEDGNCIRVSYLGADGKPILTTYGYAIEERTYTEDGHARSVKYYGEDSKPICTTYYGYGKINKYDENGNVVEITYIDEDGDSIIAGIGYASVKKTLYTEGKDTGRVKKEFYFDADGKPMRLSVGYSGVLRGYDEHGENTIVTYLDSEGNPTINSQGYTTLVRGYYSTYTTERYYDADGNPVALSEGQYGIKRENGKVTYLNAAGYPVFNLKNLLHYQSRIVVIFGVIVVLLSAVTGKKVNIALLITYLLVIGYLTLMFRESGDSRFDLQIFSAFNRMFANANARADILKNIWLFIPLGATLYNLFPHKRILIVPFLLSCLIELTQYVTGTGLCELDDVISNGLGGVIGYYAGDYLGTLKAEHMFSNAWHWIGKKYQGTQNVRCQGTRELKTPCPAEKTVSNTQTDHEESPMIREEEK